MAQVAEMHASNCQLKIYANTPQDYESVGQIWAVAGSTALDLIKIVEKSWLSSSIFYTYATNSCSTRGACTSYTQVSIGFLTNLSIAINYTINQL